MSVGMVYSMVEANNALKHSKEPTHRDSKLKTIVLNIF